MAHHIDEAVQRLTGDAQVLAAKELNLRVGFSRLSKAEKTHLFGEIVGLHQSEQESNAAEKEKGSAMFQYLLDTLNAPPTDFVILREIPQIKPTMFLDQAMTLAREIIDFRTEIKSASETVQRGVSSNLTNRAQVANRALKFVS